MDNHQAQAYAIITMKEKGFNMEDIDKVRWGMYSAMDSYTEEEVENKARNILLNE